MKTFEFILTSTKENLHNFELQLLEILQGNTGLTNLQINELSLAVIEAVGNAIRHGNKFDISKYVYIKITITKKIITVVVKDEGEGFDINQVDDPTKPENLLKTSGRGIYIMRNIMKEFLVNTGKNGTIVKMKYYIC